VEHGRRQRREQGPGQPENGGIDIDQKRPLNGLAPPGEREALDNGAQSRPGARADRRLGAAPKVAAPAQ
jgi:hypothetical protein